MSVNKKKNKNKCVLQKGKAPNQLVFLQFGEGDIWVILVLFCFYF